jgi:hypothetical protein
MAKVPTVEPDNIPPSFGPWHRCIACRQMHKGAVAGILCLETEVKRLRAELDRRQRLYGSETDKLLHVGQK